MSERTIHIEPYYTCMEYLMGRFDRFARQMAFRAETAEECAAWQHELRARVAELLGLPTMLQCPLDPEVTERTEMDGYVRERVLLRTEPGVIMPLYVLIPGDLRQGERRAAVLAPHGHGSAGKFSPGGRRDIPAVEEQILRRSLPVRNVEGEYPAPAPADLFLQIRIPPDVIDVNGHTQVRTGQGIADCVGLGHCVDG